MIRFIPFGSARRVTALSAPRPEGRKSSESERATIYTETQNQEMNLNEECAGSFARILLIPSVESAYRNSLRTDGAQSCFMLDQLRYKLTPHEGAHFERGYRNITPAEGNPCRKRRMSKFHFVRETFPHWSCGRVRILHSK